MEKATAAAPNLMGDLLGMDDAPAAAPAPSAVAKPAGGGDLLDLLGGGAMGSSAVVVQPAVASSASVSADPMAAFDMLSLDGPSVNTGYPAQPVPKTVPVGYKIHC